MKKELYVSANHSDIKFLKIRDFLNIKYGKGLKESDRKPGNIPVYGSNGIVGEHSQALSTGKTIIIGRKGSVGEVHISNGPCWPIDTTYFVDEFKGLDPLYVYHLLRSLKLGTLDTSTAIPGVNRNHIYDKEVSLPSFEQQKMIVKKLNELLPSIRSAQEKIVRARAILRRFRQAVLDAACCGELTTDCRNRSGISDQWSELELGDVITDLGQGWSPKCEVQPSSSPDMWGVIKTTAIQPMNFSEIENKKLPAALKPRQSLELHAGDLLITRAGPRDRAGVCCLVRSVRPKLILCDKAYRFHAIEERAIPDFIEIILNAPKMLIELDKIKTGISDSGLNLTQTKFLSLPITLPTIPEQKEIVKRIRSYFEIADRVEQSLAKIGGYCETTTRAVLTQAFAGQLS